MAAGDPVVGISATTANWVYYQPAASVSVCITAVFDTVKLYDGVISVTNFDMVNDRSGPQKIIVTNSIYLGYYGTLTGTGFSGIQIQ